MLRDDNEIGSGWTTPFQPRAKNLYLFSSPYKKTQNQLTFLFKWGGVGWVWEILILTLSHPVPFNPFFFFHVFTLKFLNCNKNKLK